MFYINMKWTWLKFIFLTACMVVFLSSMLITSQATEGSDTYTDSFPLQTFDFRMYVVSLTTNDTFIMNVTAVGDGEFDVFLFSTRPKASLVSRDGYNPEIFNNLTGTTLAYDNSTGKFSNITYSPSNPEYPVALYYIQVVLIDRGPDSYILHANFPLELYFIPFIPGYPILLVSGISLLTLSFIFFHIRKRMIKH